MKYTFFHKTYILKVLLIILLCNTGCKKFVEVNPPVTSLNSGNVYSADATAISALTGVYSTISNSSIFSSQLSGMSGLAELSADELTLYSGADPTLQLYYKNALTINNNGTDFWLQIYPVIFMVNSAIEGLSQATSLTPAVKQQLMGEAKFCRAFSYFYLVNLYGDVPLVLTTDYVVNAVLPRAPKTQIWEQIIQDLKDAQSSLSSSYLDATLLNTSLERVRPTKWAAIALLARVYLYTNNWASADSAASLVINYSSQYSLSSLDSVFLKNSTEAIWQLQPVTNNGFNTQDALSFILTSSGPSNSNPVYLNKKLVNSFDSGDQRKQQWIDSVIVNGITYYYPYKYKSRTLNALITEYSMVLRLGELYLIRAEAKAHLNDLPNSVKDINVIRNRANLSPSTDTSQENILSTIQHERSVELFTEWGHRWLDLKRTDAIDSVMGNGGACVSKGGTWNSNWKWYPIPQTELNSDPKLVQNPGY